MGEGAKGKHPIHLDYPIVARRNQNDYDDATTD